MIVLKVVLFLIIQALLVLLYKVLKTKNNGLFKNILFILFEIVLITWFVPAGYFDNGQMSNVGMYSVGFFDFFQLLFGTFEFAYFLQMLILIVSIGALYGVLSKTGKYRAWIEKIANNLKGKEFIFLVGVTIIVAGLTSVFDYGLALFIFFPLLISIILTMGYDKITAILATFGATLIGTIGSTINYNTAGIINEQLGKGLSNAIYYRIGLLVFSLAALIFVLYKAKRNSKKNEAEEIPFIGEKTSNKYSVLPIIIIFGILFVLLVLGCTNWINTFNVSAFSNLNNKFTELKIGEFEVHTLIGTISEFGKWYYAEMGVMCILAALLIARFFRMKHTDTLAYMKDGAKKMLAPALLVVLCYSAVYFAGNTMFFTTIADFILTLTNKFNFFLSSIVMALGSLIHVDMLYIGSYVMPQLVVQEVSAPVISILIQSIYGITMFVAPTSAMLILGLSYLNVSYKEWIKKTWKLVLILLGLSLAAILLAMFI